MKSIIILSSIVLLISSLDASGYTLYDRNRQGLDWDRGGAYGPDNQNNPNCEEGNPLCPNRENL